MTILERDDRSKVKASGKVNVDVVYDAVQTLKTPAGQFDCHRIRITWDAEFDMGQTRSLITCYYSPEVGLVAEDYQSESEILLFKRDRHITAVMAEPPQPLTAKAE